MRIIVITNQKGGCGKTTTSLNLAAALAQMGQKVLLIDLDPQAHATLGLGYDPENVDNTIYHVISNRRFSIAKTILDTKIEGLHLIPSNIRLSKVELELTLVSQKEFILADQLKKISGNYDICIIDCPPSLGLLTSNALVASTDIIVPVQVHYYALEGLKQLLETIKTARKQFQPCPIKILGLLLTFVEDRAALSQQVEQQMKKFFGDLVFKTVIHRTISLAEAPSAGEPIITYAPTSKGTAEYMALAKEVLDSQNQARAQEPVDLTKVEDKIQLGGIKQTPTKPRIPISEEIIAKPSAPVKEPEPVQIAKESTVISSAPARKNHIGRIMFLLFLLIITAAVAVITFINNPPTAEPSDVNVPEDTPTNITLIAKDKDRDTLTSNITTKPEHGLISGNGLDVIYTPDKDYTGPDSFAFNVSDGKLDSNSVTVSITVIPVNDPPVADSQSVSIKVDKSLQITLKGSDSDSSKITFLLLTAPMNGSLSKLPGYDTNGKVLYTPKSGYTGTDSFSFATNDGESNSMPATVKIDVTQNTPPVAENETISTVEDAPVTITLKGDDADGDTLTYKIVSEPSHGKLDGEAPNLTYVANGNYNGPDSFTYSVNDGKQDSKAAVVSITVKTINDAPVANNENFTTQEDTQLPITLVATDPDGDLLTYYVVSQPSHGTISQTPPNLIYTPENNYYGSDSFTFKVNDSIIDSPTAMVSIKVEPVEDTPVASNESVTLLEDTSANITLKAIDPDGDQLTYTIERAPSRGKLSGTGPEVIYTPDIDFNWLDSFTFSVSDGKSKSNTATVYITVNPGNDPPVANDDKAETFEDTPIDSIKVLANDNDPDKDTLTIKDAAQASHGKTEINPDNTIKYIPDPNYHGSDSFTYTAADSDGAISTAKVEILVTQVNDSPRIISAPLTTAMPNITYIYDVNAVDPDAGDTLTYSLVSKPDGMTIGQNSGIIEWMPDDITAEPVKVTVKVTDNNDIPSSATQTFSIQVVPAPPKINTLTVTDACDKEGNSVFSANNDVNIVLTSNKKYLQIKPNSITAFSFSDTLAPLGSKITSFVIYIEHYEETSFSSGAEKWSIGKDWPANPEVWFTIDAPVCEGEKSSSVDSWDAASIVETPQKANEFQLQIINNDSYKSIFIDSIYVLAQWDWPESSGLVEYKLESVKTNK
jgi:cellulose biosynthesis protein BcsQ